MISPSTPQRKGCWGKSSIICYWSSLSSYFVVSFLALFRRMKNTPSFKANCSTWSMDYYFVSYSPKIISSPIPSTFSSLPAPFLHQMNVVQMWENWNSCALLIRTLKWCNHYGKNKFFKKVNYHINEQFHFCVCIPYSNEHYHNNVKVEAIQVSTDG